MFVEYQLNPWFSQKSNPIEDQQITWETLKEGNCWESTTFQAQQPIKCLTVIAVEWRPMCKENCCDEFRLQQEASIKRQRALKPRLDGSNLEQRQNRIEAEVCSLISFKLQHFVDTIQLKENLSQEILGNIPNGNQLKRRLTAK